MSRADEVIELLSDSDDDVEVLLVCQPPGAATNKRKHSLDSTSNAVPNSNQHANLKEKEEEEVDIEEEEDRKPPAKKAAIKKTFQLKQENNETSDEQPEKRKTSPLKRIWVMDGKTQHQACLLEEGEGDRKLIRWESGGEPLWIDGNRVAEELQPRRAKLKAQNANENIPDTSRPVAVSPTSVTSSSPTNIKVEPSTAARQVSPSMPAESVYSAASRTNSRSIKSVPDVTTNLTGPQISPANANARSRMNISNASNNDTMIPDGPVSSNGEATHQILAGVFQDIRIKTEGSLASLSPQEKERRRKMLDFWRKMNTDPRTGEGRFVFRRACHVGSISAMLGGGMDPWPTCMKPPPHKSTGETNPFIKPGEFYVAGNESFNSFGPRFPGDDGLINVSVFANADIQKDMGINQTEFHFFVQCSARPCDRHWHGKDAKGGRLYLGVYRMKFPDDEVMTPVTFKELGCSFQKDIADFFLPPTTPSTSK